MVMIDVGQLGTQTLGSHYMEKEIKDKLVRAQFYA
jgi:hypothetical protein